jgi:hypothetical protein
LANVHWLADFLQLFLVAVHRNWAYVRRSLADSPNWAFEFTSIRSPVFFSNASCDSALIQGITLGVYFRHAWNVRATLVVIRLVFFSVGGMRNDEETLE